MLRYLLESGNYTIKAGDVVESSAQDLKVRNQRVWVDGSVTVANGAVVSVNGTPEPAGTKHTIKTINAIYAYSGPMVARVPVTLVASASGIIDRLIAGGN